MPATEARGVRKRGSVQPCEACAGYGPRPDAGPWGGECSRPDSDAMMWTEKGFRFTAPNDTCSKWTRR